MKQRTHFRDPCIHCGAPHDEVEAGACKGDPEEATVLEYCVDRQAYENPGSGCDYILRLMSTGAVTHDARHPSSHWPWNRVYKTAETLARHEFYAKHMRAALDGKQH